MKAGDVGQVHCKKHGDQFIDYKCRFCCSQALFFCFGTHHFCDPCHRRAWELRNKKPNELGQCGGKDKCPLKIEHPLNGNEFSLGCGLCRETKLKVAQEENKEILDF